VLFFCNFAVVFLTLNYLIVNKNILLILNAVFISLIYHCSAQVVSKNQDSVKILMKKEHSFSANIHTQGFGIGYRHGKHLTAYKKLMFEGEIVTMKHPKEIKSLYPIDENSKSYIYGKLNSFFIIRPGIGIQKVINSKPYWGGIEVRYFYYAGLSLGFTKPVYLFIWNYKPGSFESRITTEKYDPAKHDVDNIYGRAPFTNGIEEIQIHPGLYGKFGFNFEFGQEDKKIRCLEAGINFDAYTKSIPIMAFNNNSQYFFTIYLSYSFGRRIYQ
jgi:hypothetical protein